MLQIQGWIDKADEGLNLVSQAVDFVLGLTDMAMVNGTELLGMLDPQFGNHTFAMLDGVGDLLTLFDEIYQPGDLETLLGPLYSQRGTLLDQLKLLYSKLQAVFGFISQRGQRLLNFDLSSIPDAADDFVSKIRDNLHAKVLKFTFILYIIYICKHQHLANYV